MLLQRVESSRNITVYPAISPLLVLRTAVNSVTQSCELKGGSPAFSPNNQHIITTEDNVSWLYSLDGSQIAEFRGGFPTCSPDGQLVLAQEDDIGRL
jgi:hypothetical protein